MHNGWTNYATWRVNAEIFSDLDSDYWEEQIEELSKYDFGQHLKDYLEQLISIQVKDTKKGLLNYAEMYALAFINDVNWSEIAEHIIDTYRENYCCDNCNERLDEKYMSRYCSSECQKEDELLATHEKG